MIEERSLNASETQKLLAAQEDHFCDFKSTDIQPAKLQETFIAFANADGGDIFIGIEDKKYKGDRIRPFASKEDANAMLAVLLEQTTPAVENVMVEFLSVAGGSLLHISIPKSPRVHYTASGDCYVRLNAAKVKIKGERVTSLAYSKGSVLYERVPVQSVSVDEISNSPALDSYRERVTTSLEPERFLRKQRLLSEKEGIQVPNVGCVLLFDEEPQASVETRCAIKVYRLRTTDSDYKREHLADMPATINGPLESQIFAALSKVAELVAGASYYEGEKLVALKYPVDAIKELLVNAVIHRDYSLNDDIHIRIFDNRIEISSPGKLPGYMTIDNLYEERFSRNPNIVRMLHNLPDPLNHDIGEGLDTVRNELNKAGLVAPAFELRGNAFVVTIRHQRMASVEDVVMQHLDTNPSVLMTNKLARQLSGEDDINKVKKALQKLRADGKIEVVDPSAAAFNFQYKKV
ncbi:putative DNA binding domain-containing protein [Xanthomonas translucens pv. translucens]|nr:ATP-binding protein [Xanthomonas translucens]QSQ45763.1 putative DNA binding domain-containing protein [Xanthomonas translucens pv. translucens]